MMAALTEVARGCMAFQANSKLNKIVFKPNNEKVDNIIVYFGGDVQNLEGEMLKSKTNAKYSEHSIEASITKIAQSYQSSLVLAVLPIRMEMETFSCYDNFVKSNEVGAPKHSCSADVQALSHLYNLMTTSTSVIPPSLSKLPFKLIGFSKGVVVLNQLLFDWHALNVPLKDDKDLNCPYEKTTLKEWFSQIETICWLDGGHNGSCNTWISEADILRSLIYKSNVKADVRVTPYQIKDFGRPWIREEEARFSSILKKFCESDTSRFQRSVYFENEKGSLANHFRIVDTICDVQLL